MRPGEPVSIASLRPAKYFRWPTCCITRHQKSTSWSCCTRDREEYFCLSLRHTLGEFRRAFRSSPKSNCFHTDGDRVIVPDLVQSLNFPKIRRATFHRAELSDTGAKHRPVASSHLSHYAGSSEREPFCRSLKYTIPSCGKTQSGAQGGSAEMTVFPAAKATVKA